MSKQAPMLRAGERVRLVDGGPVYRVERVNECAAYVRAEYAVPKVVTIGELTFEAHQGGELRAISPRSLVERVTG